MRPARSRCKRHSYLTVRKSKFVAICHDLLRFVTNRLSGGTPFRSRAGGVPDGARPAAVAHGAHGEHLHQQPPRGAERAGQQLGQVAQGGPGGAAAGPAGGQGGAARAGGGEQRHGGVRHLPRLAAGRCAGGLAGTGLDWTGLDWTGLCFARASNMINKAITTEEEVKGSSSNTNETTMTPALLAYVYFLQGRFSLVSMISFAELACLNGFVDLSYRQVLAQRGRRGRSGRQRHGIQPLAAASAASTPYRWNLSKNLPPVLAYHHRASDTRCCKRQHLTKGLLGGRRAVSAVLPRGDRPPRHLQELSRERVPVPPVPQHQLREARRLPLQRVRLLALRSLRPCLPGAAGARRNK
eukprot:1193384-Prorocentrum_minimum.AAC.4